jgi:hypothetical protein
MFLRVPRLPVALATLGAAAHCAAAAPVIQITNVPPFGLNLDLGGYVTGVSPSAARVAVFIFIPSSGWWSKPYCDPQLTAINADGSWTADVTTGGVDAQATKITALLVSSGYHEDCVLGLPALPANVLTQALASATVFRADPNLRWIRFSGYDWAVKTAPGMLGPGPNYFSDSTNNVWVDALGQLHLRITNVSNQWQCAEVISARTFGYGSYRFELASDVNALNLNAVLGLFTYGEDPGYAHREIDVECSRWGNSFDINNSQFVVQPWDSPGHLARYPVPAGLPASTHAFTWETNRISFQSLRGSYSPNPAPGNVVTNWTYTLDVPQTGDEVVHLNLWLFNTTPPLGNVPVEFVVKSFQFVPLGPPRPAVLSAPERAGDAARFVINGGMDRRYDVQSSTNLAAWETIATVLATNAAMPFATTNQGGRAWFRTLTKP